MAAGRTATSGAMDIAAPVPVAELSHEEIKEAAVDNIAPTVNNCTQLYTTVHNVMLSTADSFISHTAGLCATLEWARTTVKNGT